MNTLIHWSPYSLSGSHIHQHVVRTAETARQATLGGHAKRSPFAPNLWVWKEQSVKSERNRSFEIVALRSCIFIVLFLHLCLSVSFLLSSSRIVCSPFNLNLLLLFYRYLITSSALIILHFISLPSSLVTSCLPSLSTVLYAFGVLIDIFIAVWHMFTNAPPTIAIIAATSGLRTPPADTHHQYLLDPLYRSPVALSAFAVRLPLSFQHMPSFVHFVPFRICSTFNHSLLRFILYTRIVVCYLSSSSVWPIIRQPSKPAIKRSMPAAKHKDFNSFKLRLPTYFRSSDYPPTLKLPIVYPSSLSFFAVVLAAYEAFSAVILAAFAAFSAVVPAAFAAFSAAFSAASFVVFPAAVLVFAASQNVENEVHRDQGCNVWGDDQTMDVQCRRRGQAYQRGNEWWEDQKLDSDNISSGHINSIFGLRITYIFDPSITSIFDPHIITNCSIFGPYIINFSTFSPYITEIYTFVLRY